MTHFKMKNANLNITYVGVTETNRKYCKGLLLTVQYHQISLTFLKGKF